jgi:uncharacterized protein (TIGR02466 family)
MDNSFYFNTPIKRIEKPEYLNSLINFTELHIKESKKELKKFIEERNKNLNKDIKDRGISYHSTPLMKYDETRNFSDYVLNVSEVFLKEIGYDLNNYKMFMTELWVQEFSKNGGGYHESHVHYDSHISGFYFLKCSENTSYPVFHDPRPAKRVTQLPLINEKEITLGSDKIFYKVTPGTFLFFPSYLEHEFIPDLGIDPFRFIHFNVQAIRK